ncbi:MAG TPA: HAMP domain-containing sensor histidine kinase [Nitrososphaeraceae archaeon]|nr:HAMP domain-containing sensor histidine kinase [Nitrososphaeraceae archaeon]
MVETSSSLLIVSSYGGMQLIYNNFLNHYKRFLDKYKKGESKEGIKWICNIEKENLELVKTFLKMGMQLRHVTKLPPLNFALGNSEINATIEKMENGKMVQSLLISNEPLYVKHFLSIFENLWMSGIDAKDRLKELEQDIEPEGIGIIRNPYEVQKLVFDLLRTTEDEILIVFSTANAFHRQEKVGTIKIVREIAAKKNNNIKVKILTPVDSKIEETKKELENEILVNDKNEEREINKKEKQQNSKNIQIKFIERHSQTTVSILIVDRKYILAAELKDDTKDTSIEAIGLATYSNSKSTVLSYVSMFETLWLQTEISDLLRKRDNIQKEFINVASHELRTPIQPILVMSDILYSRIKDKEQRNYLEIIIRNAKRLQRLTDDILDVAKIETGTLQIKKEKFNLYNTIANLLSQYKTSIKEIKETKNVNFLYIAEEQNLTIEGDKKLLIQVLDNLLSNAIKFTKKLDKNATITITTKREMNNDNNNNTIIVGVKDNGTGIDKEILPRLFTKFTTKSEAGTGLGLYISKKIIEAHGGKIWAENNLDGKGATFNFTMPI